MLFAQGETEHQKIGWAFLAGGEMDVAWKLGTGSKANDWELRISMRSFRKYFGVKCDYWIIGHIPAWIDTAQVNCLPWPDPYKHCKDANLLHKAIRLAMEAKLSDPFIFCSDDQILLKSIEPDDFKPWCSGEIPIEVEEGMNGWERRLVNTGKRLRNSGFRAMNYECHVPYLLRKELVREALRFDFGVKPGMCVHSTILNCSKEPGVMLNTEHIRARLGGAVTSEKVIDDKLAKNRFANLNAKSLSNKYLVRRIEQMFPDPAPWELDGPVWARLYSDAE